MSNHDRMTLFDLKEKAKWSTYPEEKKAAIKEISNHGEDTISELQEIMHTTAYEDIKNTCAEAIMSIQTRNKEEEVVKINETSPPSYPPSYSPSSHPPPTHDSNSTTDLSTTAAKSQKKEGEKLENEAESTREKEVRLADMPR
jgi:hypothetical protein